MSLRAGYFYSCARVQQDALLCKSPAAINRRRCCHHGAKVCQASSAARCTLPCVARCSCMYCPFVVDAPVSCHTRTSLPLQGRALQSLASANCFPGSLPEAHACQVSIAHICGSARQTQTGKRCALVYLTLPGTHDRPQCSVTERCRARQSGSGARGALAIGQAVHWWSKCEHTSTYLFSRTSIDVHHVSDALVNSRARRQQLPKRAARSRGKG